MIRIKRLTRQFHYLQKNRSQHLVWIFLFFVPLTFPFAHSLYPNSSFYLRSFFFGQFFIFCHICFFSLNSPSFLDVFHFFIFSISFAFSSHLFPCCTIFLCSMFSTQSFQTFSLFSLRRFPLISLVSSRFPLNIRCTVSACLN